MPAAASLAEGAGEVAGDQRDAEEDQHAAGDVPDRHVQRVLREPEPARQHLEVEVPERGEGDDLNTELIATRTAAASRSPPDRSFQISTMAMQRASPTMISPVRWAGWSGSSSQARANISAGPTIQFNTSEETRSRRSPVTAPSSP